MSAVDVRAGILQMWRWHKMPVTVNPTSGIIEEYELFSQFDFNSICMGISWRNWKWPFCYDYLVY